MHGFLTYGVSFVVVLGVLIFVHELGHFIAARLFGVRVDVFSFGFGPRLWGRKRGDTDYRLSAFPLGGYVKMAGDNPTEQRAGAPYEFLSKPRWQRAIIASAGPGMNFILAIVLMTCLYKVGGPQDPFLKEPARVEAVMPGSRAAVAGIRPGDLYVDIDGKKNPTWGRAFMEAELLSPLRALSVVVLRNGVEVPLTVHPSSSKRALNSPFDLLGDPKYEVRVDAVKPGEPGDAAEMKVNDVVESMNGQSLTSSTPAVVAIRNSDGRPVSFVVRRNGQGISLTVHPVYGDPGDGEKRWHIGVAFGPVPTYASHGWGEAFEDGIAYNVGVARQVMDVVVGLLSLQISPRELGGPVAIAQHSGDAAKQGPLAFLVFMALISVNLGILNLLPIPILDGGHLLLLAIEGTLRRDLSIPVKERFVQVGLVFLLALFCFVMYSDIAKIVHR